MATKKAVSEKMPAKAASPVKAAEKTASAHMAKMTKTQIVKAMAEKLEVETKQVQSFFDALAEMATEQTREAGEFTVPGLGKLVKAERKERMGRNPQTGEVPRGKGSY
jgi:DNA-binding protein HU-beta